MADVSTHSTGIPTSRNPSRAGQPEISILPSLFLVSLMTPILMPAGPVLLMPHRLLLILVFFPLLFKLLSGAVGRILWSDYLFFFIAVWATVSYFVSSPGCSWCRNPFEATGIHWVEFFGAYMVGRVAVRSAEGFARFVKLYFILMMILLPFAALESLTNRPVFLDLIPNSISPTYTDGRWGMRRAQTAFDHPILFGVFASSAFGLFWWVLRPNFMRLSGAAASMGATVFSLSTGALISLNMQITFIIWEFITKKIVWRWRLFGGLAVLGYVAIDTLSNRTPFHVLVDYASFNQGSAYSRILIWEWGTASVAKYPLFGMGLEVAAWERPWWKSGSTDNFWLLIAMEFGLPAIIAFGLALALILRGAALSKLTDPLAKRCQAGFLTTMGGLIIAGGTVHYWHAMLAFAMFFFGSGVWLYTTEPKTPSSETEGSDAGPTDGGNTRLPTYTRFAPRSSAPDAGEASARQSHRKIRHGPRPG